MDFKKIEEKWQNVWEQEKRFEVENHDPNKKNAYILIEFPYPSGKDYIPDTLEVIQH